MALCAGCERCERRCARHDLAQCLFCGRVLMSMSEQTTVGARRPGGDGKTMGVLGRGEEPGLVLV